jgi:CheY-like chemotaxis protein
MVTPLAPPAGPKPSILIADDNAEMRDCLRQLLGQRYLVRLAANGADALTALRGDRPDLVLADIMMPEFDGYALLKAIRGDPALADLLCCCCPPAPARTRRSRGWTPARTTF